MLFPYSKAEEANVNLLTGNESLDPVTGYPPYRYLPARVVKKVG
jgi:hypothetical protein